MMLTQHVDIKSAKLDVTLLDQSDYKKTPFEIAVRGGKEDLKFCIVGYFSIDELKAHKKSVDDAISMYEFGDIVRTL